MEIIASTTQHPWHSMGHALVYIIPIVIVVLAFEIWMLVDCIKNENVPLSKKVWWIVGMFIIHPFVAIAWFFVRSHYSKQKHRK